MMLYRDIYLNIASFLTPHETRELAGVSRQTACLRMLISRKKLENSVDARPYYPKRYAKEIYVKESELYNDNRLYYYVEHNSRRIGKLSRGLIIGRLSLEDKVVSHQWYFSINNVTPFLCAPYLKLFNVATPCFENQKLKCRYAPKDREYAIRDLAIHDMIALYNWLVAQDLITHK